jgi:hypothetical protein
MQKQDTAKLFIQSGMSIQIAVITPVYYITIILYTLLLARLLI